ncbi:exonuclease SbcCD subunit D C-terminal domain-containing protein [Desulfococcaceae bacterium HSG8]|nr:exonuclease SbcCD subunit D C-terminal domain-containing protein [Desulfococcaceae bacterium HSG8]
MKILHTSDWHLGRRLGDKNRAKEHDMFLSWLVGQIREKYIDVLIVAGDIFDTGYPPNFALKQYYNFLRHIPDTPCRNVVIVGGNHDAVSTLNAPRDLLKYLNIYVIGGAEKDIAREAIVMKNGNGSATGIVCAVPFLRPRDIRKSVAGETYEQIEKSVAEGICRHYQHVCEHALTLKKEFGQHLPIIATGHLFAAGCTKTNSVRDIYVGDMGRVGADIFPREFDYVALGHIHQALRVNKQEHVRYSGAPLPLSFSEAGTKKLVLVAEFDTGGFTGVQSVEIPCFRNLIRFEGHLEDIEIQLNSCEKNSDRLTPWGQALVETEYPDPTIHGKVMTMTRGKPIEILMVRIRSNNKGKNSPDMKNIEYLEDLSPAQVFLKKCEAEGIEGEGKESLFRTFQELLLEM